MRVLEGPEDPGRTLKSKLHFLSTYTYSLIEFQYLNRKKFLEIVVLICCLEYLIRVLRRSVE
jgi:hypothetical protein